MTVSVSAAPFLSTFSSFLLTRHFEKVSWPRPPKKKGSRLEAPVRESWQEAFQLYSHLLRAMVHTAVIYEPLWHSGRLCYWWVWGTFHVRFYTLHKLLLRVSLGLPCYSFTRAHDLFLPCLDRFLWYWDKEITETYTFSYPPLLALPSQLRFTSVATTSQMQTFSRTVW